MILGNSFKQNTGKKYLVRKSNNLAPVPGCETKVNSFKMWFSLNYELIIQQWRDKNNLIEDVIHDTYIRIVESLTYTDLIIDNYASYFHRSYYTNYTQFKIKESEYSDPPSENIQDLMSIDHQYIEDSQYMLGEEVFAYVHSKYSLQEFELYKMYMRLKEENSKISYRNLSEITGIIEYKIRLIVAKISRDVRGCQMFQNKKKQIRRCF